MQWWAVRCSLLTLFAIGLLLLYFAATSKANEQSRFRFPLGLQSLFLIGLGTVGLWRQATVPQIPTFHPSQSSVAVESLELLGYTSQQSDATSLYLFPYWHVRAPLPGLRAIWSIRDGAGKILSESEANPYFNTLSSQQLPDQAIFDDAYLLPLPPGLQAGSYHLFLQLHDSEVTDRFLTPAVDVGAIDLPATPPSAAPPVDFMPLALSFQGNLYLDGYTQRALGDASRSVLGQAAYPLYYAGDTLDLTLYWRSRGIVSENYHSFVHLLNWEGNPLLKIDHLPGSIAHYPRTWNDLYPVPDPYHFTIPDTLPSGLYRPLLGLYSFNRPAERLVATAEDGTKTGDILLPPVKIVGKVSTQPRQTLQGIIGAFATFQGFSIEPETLILRPAQTFTLTFFYQAQQPAN